MPDDTHPTPPSDAAPALTTTSTRTTPIAAAVRDEIRMLVDVEVLDLKLLADVVEVAKSGRELVAVRNPVARFDAKHQGIGSGSMGLGPTPIGPQISTYAGDDMEWCYGPGMGNPNWIGDGPTVRGARERQEEDVRKLLRQSPLAAAAKAEILEITAKEPFGAGELVQVEQLAAHTQRLLSARLGLSPKRESPRRAGGFGGYGYVPMDPFSSSETFGAKMGRELVNALKKDDAPDDPEKLVLAIAQARDKGLPELAAKLEARLTGTPPSSPAEPHTPPGTQVPSNGEE